MKQTGKNTYKKGGWTLTFGSRFSFDVVSKGGAEAGGVYYYGNSVKLMTGSKRLPRPILNAVIDICNDRCRAGLMPNKR